MSMFGTSGVRGPIGETVTADLALSIGRAIATAGAEAVLVGRDSRNSAVSRRRSRRRGSRVWRGRD
jgi:phosphoglucosamine mutase